VATDFSEREGCLGLLKRLFGHDEQPPTDTALPYRVRDDFLSPAERSFYGVLTDVVAGLYVVCPKVNVADLLYVVNRRANIAYLNKIDRKHVDFVLCEPGPMRPVAAVELDDSSHQRRDRQERDEFLDQAFQAAGFPVIHFAARTGYNAAAVSEEITRALAMPSKTPENASALLATSVADAPSVIAGGQCPRCGGTLVERVSRRDPNAERFLGCENYPRCRYRASIERS
jgi:very-short-patch-repair endonuclease